MKRIMKKGMAFVLAFAMVLAFMPAFPGSTADAVSFTNVEADTEFSTTSSSELYYSVDAENIKGNTDAVIFKCVSTGGTPKVVQVDENGNEIGTEHDMWSGHALSAIKAAVGSKVYFKIRGGLGCKFIINEYPWFQNDSSAAASEIFDNPETVNFEYLTYRDTYSSYGNLYYKLVADQKAKYRINASGVEIDVTNGSEDKVTIPKGQTKTFTVNKGAKLLMCVKSNCKDGTMTLYKDIFNRMTSMKFAKSSYSVLAEQSATMKLNFSKLDQSRALESTIVSKGVYNSKGNYVESVTKEDINTYKASYKYPGIYTVKVKNSEGMVASTKLKVRPKKPVVSGYTATGTSKSSTVSIYDTLADIDGYAVYLKTSSGWKYKGLTKHNSKGYNEYTVKGLKANKTYYVKVKSYKKCGTEKVYSSYSNQMKIITAPSKAPRIKSAKGVKTTYYRSKSVWHPGHWDANDVYHSGYYTKTPAYSLAAVRVSFTKVKGASSYESQYGKIDNNMVGITLSGKAKAQTRKVKVRTVKKSGRATAYGPWSKYKSVRTKAAG